MNYEERENFPLHVEDFLNDDLRLSRHESHSSSLYDSITVCSDYESQYYREKCSATWDDEDLDDNLDLEEENDNYYDDDDDTLESIDRPL